jgi:hypothetical protein
VNRLSTRNVSFTSQAIDDKGLQKITFKIFNSEGNMVQEQDLSGLGTIWKGTTQTFSLKSGTYKVVAQATDTAGSTSPEKSQEFTLSTETGSLTVSINPDRAVAAGAQWRIDNGTWKKSSITFSGLPTGSHTVEFQAITGWATPKSQNITIQAGKTASITGTYTHGTGSVTVTILPQNVIDQGAKWRVDNSLWQKSGATVSGLATGTHVVEFSIIPDWSTPENQNISVESGKTSAITVIYDTTAGNATDQS